MLRDLHPPHQHFRNLALKTHHRVNVLGIGVSPINMPIALLKIEQLVKNQTRAYVCVTNVHVIMEAQRAPNLRDVLNHAGMVTPDGVPLVWISHLKGHSEVQRVYGPDLLLAACQRSLTTGWKHYFYGGAPGVGEQLIERLCQRFSALSIAGFDTPPFRPLTSEEDQCAINQINASGADILWVGLGAPKQELWMADHLGKINVPVMIGVGAAFDFHAGLKNQAPSWMQRSGLEWLFRLGSEPRRLWKRYLINNPLFIVLTILQLLGIKKYNCDLE
jgi:N-acetylglucosaminyldiphosphoundecaprenol N-acetyl-beta-D-mannosaminyltransferase